MKKNTGLFKKGDGRAVKAGSKGGKSTVKKVGTKGMSEIGKKGALKRWNKERLPYKVYPQEDIAVIASDSIISE